MKAETEIKQSRAVATRSRLMRAMEHLCAQHGVENVTVRAVIEEAGQKNESVLQYHFKSRQGLIDAIHAERFTQTQQYRREMLTQYLATNPQPSVRDLCFLLVAPTYQLCNQDPEYRKWIKGFGLKNATVKHPIREEEIAEKNSSIQIIANLLRDRLPHLDEQMFQQRYATVIRFCGLSMSNHSKEKSAFNGAESDFFLSNLLDLLAGLFTAEVSSETQNLNDRLQ